MAVLRPRRLFRYTIMIRCGVGVVVDLFSAYVFLTVLLLVALSLFWLPVPGRWCFEMRELVVTDELGFVDEWLLVEFATVLE